MSTPEKTRAEEMPEINVDTVLPAIESFFRRITTDQWRLLKLGTPDIATEILLAELILEIIKSVSAALLKAISKNVVVTEESVQFSMGNMLSQCFGKVLDAPCVSSKGLTNLVAKEVAENVNSALSTTGEPDITQHVTPPHRLNAMVSHACKMLKSFTSKIKILCTPRPHRQRQNLTTFYRDKDLEDVDMDDKNDSAPSVVTIELETSEGSSKVSSETTTVTAVEDILRDEMSKIMEPLLDEVPDLEYEQLRSESSQEISSFAKYISQSLSKSLDKTDAAEKKKKLKPSMEEIRIQINTFFAKNFVKSWICRMLGQLKAKFHQESKVESGQSVPSLLEDIDSLLQPLQGKKIQAGKEDKLLQRLKKFSMGKDWTFIQALRDLLSNHFSPGIVRKTILRPINKKEFRRPVPQIRPDIDADIQNKMWSFMGLLRWWLYTRVSGHSQQALDRLENGSASPTKSPEQSEDATAKTSMNKVATAIIVHRLVSQVFKKAKLDCTIEKSKDIVNRLIEKLWAEVKGVDFEINTITVKTLDKAIFQDLCKKWGNTENILLSMTTGEPELENCIASFVKDHLMKSSKKRSRIGRFFSSVGKAFANICKCGNRDDVDM
ncbi:uncharacterized protein LOC116701916 [Etheostoma spectabile]|uniref:uncharacterized protein LOC116701916 n=1 Tax=Etheostoma spectabile TaxID=54343 RepID=UPI0013AF6E1D|nr:uncharacterized protein LOC116701916 [Etheostoma spectabile]